MHRLARFSRAGWQTAAIVFIVVLHQELVERYQKVQFSAGIPRFILLLPKDLLVRSVLWKDLAGGSGCG